MQVDHSLKNLYLLSFIEKMPILGKFSLEKFQKNYETLLNRFYFLNNQPVHLNPYFYGAESDFTTYL